MPSLQKISPMLSNKLLDLKKLPRVEAQILRHRNRIKPELSLEPYKLDYNPFDTIAINGYRSADQHILADS
jgi:hypothetical protein